MSPKRHRLSSLLFSLPYLLVPHCYTVGNEIGRGDDGDRVATRRTREIRHRLQANPYPQPSFHSRAGSRTRTACSDPACSPLPEQQVRNPVFGMRSRVVPRGSPSSLPGGFLLPFSRSSAMTSTVTHGLTARNRRDSIRSAAPDSRDLPVAADADAWESTYLGPKGRVTLLLRRLGALPAEERPSAGRAAQQLRAELTEAFAPARETPGRCRARKSS